MRRNESYINHQLYSDLPSILIRDDDIMDAFNRRSPWAQAEHTNSFDMIADSNNTDGSDSSSTAVDKATISISKN